MNMALLIFAFVKNGYLLRLASTLQQNWPHSFRKMSFDVWRIFLYFSQISIFACFASNGGTFLAHLLCLVGDMRCAQTLQYSWSWSRGRQNMLQHKNLRKTRRDNLINAKYLKAAEAWYFPD